MKNQVETISQRDLRFSEEEVRNYLSETTEFDQDNVDKGFLDITGGAIGLMNLLLSYGEPDDQSIMDLSNRESLYNSLINFKRYGIETDLFGENKQQS